MDVFKKFWAAKKMEGCRKPLRDIQQESDSSAVSSRSDLDCEFLQMALFLRVLTFRSKLKEQNRSTDDCIKLTFPKGSHKLLKPHPFTVLSLALFNITTFSLFRYVPYFVHLVHRYSSSFSARSSITWHAASSAESSRSFLHNNQARSLKHRVCVAASPNCS